MVLYYSDLADIGPAWDQYKKSHGNTASDALDFIDSRYAGYDDDDKNVIFASISLIEESS